MKKLVVFGDSWPVGAELLLDELPFPFLMAELMGMDVENLAEPASSIDQAVYRFLEFITKIPAGQQFADIVILFCLTSKHRGMTIINGRPKELHPQSRERHVIRYFTQIHTDELSNHNLIKNITLVQLLADHIGINVFFVSNWDRIDTLSLPVPVKLHHKTLTEILGVPSQGEDDSTMWETFRDSKYFIPNIAHPNFLGHKRIATALAGWIERNE